MNVGSDSNQQLNLIDDLPFVVTALVVARAVVGRIVVGAESNDGQILIFSQS